MKSLKDIRILVVGDIMLDTYIIGDVTRISPEAPVPIVVPKEKIHKLGGAGNVVANLRGFGVETEFCGLRGNDDYGIVLRDLLLDIGAGIDGLITYDKVKTTEKIRIMASHRSTQMLRIDYDMDLSDDKMRSHISNILYESLCTSLKFDAAIISDYNKGVVSRYVLKALTSRIPLIIADPKPVNSMLYDGIFAIVPNEKELKEIRRTGVPRVSYIIETKGSEGMVIHNSDPDSNWVTIPSKDVKVFDVTGAGDTVIAIITTCQCMGIDIVTACKIANECAHYAVSTFGTSVVPLEILKDVIISETGAKYGIF
jgi:rfaE bifunctional protein kinase chain/domain